MVSSTLRLQKLVLMFFNLSTQLFRPSTLRDDLRRTVSIAWPAILTGYGWMAMGLTDTLMVGSLGAAELGATALAHSLYFTLFVTLIGLTHSSSALISQSLGRGDSRAVGRYTSQAVWIALACSPILAWIFLSGSSFLEFAGQAPEISSGAGIYLSARSLAVIPHALFSAHRSLLDGLGRTKRVLRIVLVANGINLIANAVLIFGWGPIPAFGIAGAGYATSVSILTLLAGILWEIQGSDYAEYHLGLGRPDPAILWEMLCLGIPMSLTFALESSVFAVIGLFVGHLGVDALSAHQVVWSLMSLAFVISGGFATAASKEVGAAFGRNDSIAVDRAGRLALGLTAVSMVFIGTLSLADPRLLASFYTDDLAVQATVASIAVFGVFTVLFDGLQLVASSALRATSDSKTALYANLFAHWGVGLPLGYFLAVRCGWGLAGFWIGISLAFAVCAAWLVSAFLRLPRRVARS